MTTVLLMIMLTATAALVYHGLVLRDLAESGSFWSLLRPWGRRGRGLWPAWRFWASVLVWLLSVMALAAAG